VKLPQCCQQRAARAVSNDCSKDPPDPPSAMIALVAWLVPWRRATCDKLVRHHRGQLRLIIRGFRSHPRFTNTYPPGKAKSIDGFVIHAMEFETDTARLPSAAFAPGACPVPSGRHLPSAHCRAANAFFGIRGGALCLEFMSSCGRKNLFQPCLSCVRCASCTWDQEEGQCQKEACRQSEMRSGTLQARVQGVR